MTDRPTYEELNQKNQLLEKAERDLQRMETLLRTTQRLAKVGGWEWDLKSQTMFWTDELYRIHDFQPDDFSPGSAEHIERSIECYEPEDRPVVLEAFKNCIENGQAYDLEFLFRTGKGNQKWIRTTAEPVCEKDKIIKIIGNVIDISALKLAEEEKAKHEMQCLQVDKLQAIRTLAGGIAHDFNNILGSIIGYAEMARDDSPDESSVAQDLNKVLAASGRAAGLVRQLVAFSRQDAPENMLLQPAGIVKKTITMLRPRLTANVEIIENISPETSLIFANPAQFRQILINLCYNACHAMKEKGGKIDISLKERDLSFEELTHEPHIVAGTFIQLSVCDSGVGIRTEVMDKIFDPYFTTKALGRGVGLGLSVVHGIVKSYGGFITFHSVPGEGTAFHVFLPVVNKKVLLDKEAIKQIPIDKEKILFIDDEDLYAEMGKRMLEGLGHPVTVRKSSLEALETFRNQPDQFDIVITDQMMPGMTGCDLARRMLQIRPDIPIILCTGYSDTISKEKCHYLGIKELALKPLTKEDIEVLIRKVLDERQEGFTK